MNILRHSKFAARPRLRIAITGSSGLIGRNLKDFMIAGGHDVYTLVRRLETNQKQIHWDINAQAIEKDKLEGMDVIVHLAGESIADRWTSKKRHNILNSRVHGTKLLAKTIGELQNPPSVFISASAIGIYGHHKDNMVTEATPCSDEFLGMVCQQWEQAAHTVRDKGIRLVHPRFGIVLSSQSGALPKMLRPFSLGLGGRIGNGRQWMSWIALDDAIALLLDMMYVQKYSGPINTVSPNSVRNIDFTKTLGKVLGKPTVIPLPSFAVKTLFGEMGQKLLLEGANIQANKALEFGFQFQYPYLEEALRFELGKSET
jgi:uncharacterized protein